eukprot:6462165-Amphidinium_carterae.1
MLEQPISEWVMTGCAHHRLWNLLFCSHLSGLRAVVAAWRAEQGTQGQMWHLGTSEEPWTGFSSLSQNHYGIRFDTPDWLRLWGGELRGL